jgi:hypothetical protein
MASEVIRRTVVALSDDGQLTGPGEKAPLQRSTTTALFDDHESADCLEDEGSTTLTFEIPSTSDFLNGIDLQVFVPTIGTWLPAHKSFLIPDHALKHHYDHVKREGDRTMVDCVNQDGTGGAAYYKPFAATELIESVRLLKVTDAAGVHDKSPRKARTSTVATLSGEDVQAMNLTQRHAPQQCDLRVAKQLALQSQGQCFTVSLPLFPVPFPQQMFGPDTSFVLEVKLKNWRVMVGNLREDDEGGRGETVTLPKDDVELALTLANQDCREFDPVCGADFEVALQVHRSDFVRAKDFRLYTTACRQKGGVATFVLSTMEPTMIEVSDVIQGGQIELENVGGPIRKVWFMATDPESNNHPILSECGLAIDNQPLMAIAAKKCALQKPFFYEIDLGDKRINALHANRLDYNMKASLIVTTDEKRSYRLVCGGLVWRRLNVT